MSEWDIFDFFLCKKELCSELFRRKWLSELIVFYLTIDLIISCIDRVFALWDFCLPNTGTLLWSYLSARQDRSYPGWLCRPSCRPTQSRECFVAIEAK